MRAGDLRHEVVFESPGSTADGMFQETESWSTTLTTRAAIWPLTANEAVEAMKLEHTVTHRIRVRYRSTINARMRIKFGSRYFYIVSVINKDERNEFLDILAWEKI